MEASIDLFNKYRFRVAFSAIGVLVGYVIVICFGGNPFVNPSTVVMGGISGMFATVVLIGASFHVCSENFTLQSTYIVTNARKLKAMRTTTYCCFALSVLFGLSS